MASTFLLPTVFAEEIITIGEGSTLESAIHNAMREAIEQEVGILVGSRTLTRNQEVTKDEVILNSKGYIAGYEVLSQSQQAGIFSVKVRVNVRSEELKTGLMTALEKDALVEANLNDPRIAVIASDVSGKRYPEVEDEIIAALRQQGFSRIFTDSTNTDYVITLKIKTAKLKSVYSANIAARLVNNLGEVIYSNSFDGRSRMFTNNSEAGALDSATKRAAAGIATAAINLAANLEQHVTISATALTIDKYGGLEGLKGRIQNINGVSNVFIRSLSGGAAEFDIDYDGTAAELATQLKHAGFKILELASQYVKISA